MKKLLSLALALVLAMSLSVTAFAATGDPITGVADPDNKQSVDITAGYTPPSATAATVYHVTVGWEYTGTIAYTGAKDVYIWNPTGGDAMKYTKDNVHSQAAEWTLTGATEGTKPSVKITVTNRSNAAIQAVCGAPAIKDGCGVTTFEGHYGASDATATLNIASAAPASYTEATATEPKTDNATYTITKVDGAISTNGTIATITVTISAGT